MARSPAIPFILSTFATASGCGSRSASVETGRDPPAPIATDIPAPSTSAESAEPDSIFSPEFALGMRVYRRHFCGLCHRYARAGTGGTYGPSHDGYAATAARRVQTGEYTGRATTAADYTRESILNPDAWVVTGYESTRFRMPAYSNLTREELEALVQLLLREEPPN